MTDTTHECPAPECIRRVPREQFACRADWYRLPTELRRPILRSARGSGEHMLAMSEAIEWYRAERRVEVDLQLVLVEGFRTADSRMIAPGAVIAPDLPIPLVGQCANGCPGLHPIGQVTELSAVDLIDAPPEVLAGLGDVELPPDARCWSGRATTTARYAELFPCGLAPHLQAVAAQRTGHDDVLVIRRASWRCIALAESTVMPFARALVR